MSRPALSGQLTTPSHHTFITEITKPNGKKSKVISSEALSDKSVRVNRTWNGEIWEGSKYVTSRCTNSGALRLLMNLVLLSNNDHFHMYFDKKELPSNVYSILLKFIFGDGEQFKSIASYAVAIRRPSLFPQISMDPSFVIDAAMRGQEDVVMNILRADPSYLLQDAIVENSVGVKSKRTPLQAAIMADDVQMVEKMEDHFKRLDGLAEKDKQIKAIYSESLQRYCDLQKEKITELETSQKSTQEKAQLIVQAQHQHALYLKAIGSDDINEIYKAHQKAQENNAFDFQPYVDAILAIDIKDPQQKAELDEVMLLINAKTEAETKDAIERTGVAGRQTDDCRNKLFDELTLVQKLNRFREALVSHMQKEIIFNPHPILAGLQKNETTWNTLPEAADPNDYKRMVIFSQLVGWAQRNAPEPVRQDIRQGTYYLTEENKRRTRQSRFNDWSHRNSVVDVALSDSSVVGGVGYKFAGGPAVAAPELPGGGVRGSSFQNLCRAKTASFQNLLRRECESNLSRQCVIA